MENSTISLDRNIEMIQLRAEISSLKKQNLQLQDIEHRFRMISDTAPVMVWMSDTDKLCTYFNKGWLDFTGRSFEQEYGNGWAEGVHPDDFERCLKIYTTSFDERVNFSMEYRLRRFDGQYRWILDNGVPRYAADDEFLGYIGSCIDISEQKNLNQQLQDRNLQLQRKNRELKAFNYIATHDLQEPLQKLVNYSQLVSTAFPETLSPVVNSYLGKIREEAENSRQLINTLLQYTLLSDETKWKTDTDLNIVLQEALADSTDQHQASKPEMIIENELPVLSVVPWRIKKVFTNLISNSIRFARKDADPVIRVRASYIQRGSAFHPSFKEIPYWEISFKDNGEGFDNDQNELIFEVFRKVGKSSNSGAGVGLAIAKKIVNHHDGEIFAESRYNEGACFRIYLPA